MQIMDLMGMYFDAAVVFVTSTSIQIGSGHTVNSRVPIIGVQRTYLENTKVNTKL